MAIVSAALVTILFTGGSYLLLSRSRFDLVLGIALLSAGTNILLISMGGWDPSSLPAFVTDLGQAEDRGREVAETYADPLPQALILTALVIGFGFLSFLIVLVSRSEVDLPGPNDEEVSVRGESG
ncbi:MAG: NADH-quinone oxidoreductase subunit K [Candidatus Omnitrophica bacterium]|nr:NADH-quinone oxidoreductase subunit K [Candidatus Omnitrophota bacterium]MCB9769227.1 NADH-quinone oxidoreductase subunit K [Candidatus Omnitrophota bacterium]